MIIKEHMEVIGADGVHIGTVDNVEGGRIKLVKKTAERERTKGTITSLSVAWLPPSRATRFAYLQTPMWQ